MTHIQKMVLWSIAVCMCGYLSARLLIIEAPGPVLAQSPPADQSGAARSAAAPLSPTGGAAPRTQGALPVLTQTSPNVPSGLPRVMLPHRQTAAQQRVDAAVKRLREARSEKAKRAANDSLRAVLADIFSEDMQARERQAQEIETRLAKLRQQYQARAKVKERIIDLQLQVLENDAAGLGFPTAPPGSPTRASTLPGDRSMLDGGVPSRGSPPRSNVPTGRADQNSQGILDITSPRPAGTPFPVPAAPAWTVGEYNELRSQYLNARYMLRDTDERMDRLLAEARKQKPDATRADIQKQHPAEWGNRSAAHDMLQEAQRLLEAKLRLLDLDRKKAALAHKTAADRLERLTVLKQRGAVPQTEIDGQRAAAEAAALEVERAHTLYELFSSIKQAAPPAAATSNESAASALSVPTVATSAMVSVRELLALKPARPGIDYDQPADADRDSCRVVLEAGAAWSLLNRAGVLLRQFEDTNRDGKVDTWKYYKAGHEVYRDVDSDHDGRIDRHEAPESIP